MRRTALSAPSPGSGALAAGAGAGAAQLAPAETPNRRQPHTPTPYRHRPNTHTPRSYAHVNDSCLLASPTAKWYKAWVAAGGRPEELVVHLEAAADIDGIAVKWGIGNKFESPEECAHDCWCVA